MHEWNKEKRGFSMDESEIRPGLTLADAKGQNRIRKLMESRDNLQAIIRQHEDQVRCIDHEIATLRG